MITTKEYLELNKKFPWYSKPYEGQEEDKEKMREYNKSLIAKYPWLEPRNAWSGKKISDCANGEKGFWPGNPDELPDWDWDRTLLDDMPNGWRLAFGDIMCEELQKELEKFNYVDEYRITQIKEKYGYLHWYDGGVPVGKLSEEYEIVKTDNWRSISENKQDDDYYKYIGQEGDIFIHHRYKILDKCKVWDIISKYEKLSWHTCIRCGKPSSWSTRLWISPYCNDCKKELEDSKDFYDEFELIKEEY